MMHPKLQSKAAELTEKKPRRMSPTRHQWSSHLLNESLQSTIAQQHPNNANKMMVLHVKHKVLFIATSNLYSFN